MLSEISELFQGLVTAFLFVVPVILSLVNAIKEIFGLEGKVNMAVSFGVGVILSGVFAVGYFIPSASEIIAVVFFVLASGLVTSGFYQFATRLVDGDGK